MRFFHTARRRAGHRNDYSNRSENSLKRCKQQHGELPDDVKSENENENILEIVNTHKYRRRLKGLCRDHRYLHKYLRKCFENNSTDPELINNILVEIFKCEGNLGAIFRILLPNHVTRGTCHSVNIHLLYPGYHAKVRRKSSVEAFEYYLKHVCQCSDLVIQASAEFDSILNHEFDLNRTYTPLLAATMRRDPELVLLLLRYGANPHCSIQNGSDFTEPIENLITGLNSITMFKNSEFNEETKMALSDEENRGMLCLQYFYRAVTHIHIVQNTHFVATEETEESSTDSRVKVYNIHPGLASCLDLNRLSGPRSLQHLSRCVIRRSIQSSCSFTTILPDLIQTLPLPKNMKLYVDLQCD